MLYHIDTDMGVDDALALVLANRVLGDIAGISSVVGNIEVGGATRNALIFRELLHRSDQWTVVQGADRASCGYRPDAYRIHGPDGLGGATSLLSEDLKHRVAQSPILSLQAAQRGCADEVAIVGLGPATNVPALVQLYGRRAVRRIVLMTGVFFDAGNMTPHAEFNAHADPGALRTTLELGIPTTLVPLDLTRKIQLPAGVFGADRRPPASDLARLMQVSHARYAEACKSSEGIDGFFAHDAIAVLAMAFIDRFHTTRGRVDVLLDGEVRGRTVLTSDAASHIEVAMGGDLKWARQVLRDACASVN